MMTLITAFGPMIAFLAFPLLVPVLASTLGVLSDRLRRPTGQE